MSTRPDLVEQGLSDKVVADFLTKEPGFFERNARLLTDLRLPHASGGTVSLVERQVSVLRQRELKLERQLKDLIDVASDNDVLAAKIHKLALQLLAAPTLAATVQEIETATRAGFNAEYAVLTLFGNPSEFDDLPTGRFLRVLLREDAELGPFTTFMQSSTPRCGQARDSQLAFLFHDEASEIGSVAMVPLGEECSVGFLSIGSTDKNRFHPGMSIDFLTRVGELVTGALRRY